MLKTLSFYILLYIYLDLCAKREPLNSFIFTNKFMLRNSLINLYLLINLVYVMLRLVRLELSSLVYV